ncbi:carboxypeptidase-like regulatory domain-containing protein [Paenarthrobacter sp. NPDC091711]|uniref:carboxypeptidase-like regulatory domain-containing protein n=1 Tax=Micrococcaceae TaxID=1268 RepID=UPI0008995FDA|nr:carboxypeptidase-like regulatory domain-containing protein [Arthrobacter sp. cf158]SDX50132.1 hypothetical protein SAMN04487912_11459 [Arthrobacter sp. cf158]
MAAGQPEITLAVWGADGPAVVGSTLSVHVGARSRSGGSLAGQTVIVRGAAGHEVGSGKLGGNIWPGTLALWWTSVEVPVPAEPGLHVWHASVGTSHFAFSVAAVPAPAHTLTVTVFNTTNAEIEPLPGTHVRAGHHAATTDESGGAVLALPPGRHTVEAWKQGYGSVKGIAVVGSDTEISLVTEVIADKDPQYVREHWR